MAIETLKRDPTGQVEAFLNSLPDQEEKRLILDFLDNPVVSAKIEKTPDHFRNVSNQEKSIISGEFAGWVFEWLAFTYLSRHTNHILLSPQDVSNLYLRIYPERESTGFFFQGEIPTNIRVPDMMEVGNAKNTLQIMRVVEAKAGRQSNNMTIQVRNLYGNLLLKTERTPFLLSQAMHEIRPKLDEKRVTFHPKCKIMLAVPSNFDLRRKRRTLIKIPISSTTLHRLTQAIVPELI